MFVEGKLGTGKIFLTKTLYHITKLLTKRNSLDMALAPTGCATTIIKGLTHCRSCSIPGSKALYKTPTNINISNSASLCSMRK